jgi:hypothetical protein
MSKPFPASRTAQVDFEKRDQLEHVNWRTLHLFLANLNEQNQYTPLTVDQLERYTKLFMLPDRRKIFKEVLENSTYEKPMAAEKLRQYVMFPDRLENNLIELQNALLVVLDGGNVTPGPNARNGYAVLDAHHEAQLVLYRSPDIVQSLEEIARDYKTYKPMAETKTDK